MYLTSTVSCETHNYHYLQNAFKYFKTKHNGIRTKPNQLFIKTTFQRQNKGTSTLKYQ